MGQMSHTAVLFYSFLAAAIPTLFYLFLIYSVDRYEKEPLWLLSATFLWGAVPAILLAFFFNTVLGSPFYLLTAETQTATTAVAVFIAPFVEESVKGAALLLIFLFWQQEIDSPLDGIIYGAMVGFGFAMVENIYYFINEYSWGGGTALSINIFMRSVLFGLNHALFSSLTGLGIAVARLTTRTSYKWSLPIIGWATAVFLHFMHNFTVSVGSVWVCLTFILDWGGVWLMLAIIVWALLQERRWLKTYLASEVQQGTLTSRQYELACSGHRRALFNLEQLFGQGWRANRQASAFFHRCSELAYKKHHQQLFHDEKSAATIVRLRREIADLSHKLL